MSAMCGDVGKLGDLSFPFLSLSLSQSHSISFSHILSHTLFLSLFSLNPLFLSLNLSLSLSQSLFFFLFPLCLSLSLSTILLYLFYAQTQTHVHKHASSRKVEQPHLHIDTCAVANVVKAVEWMNFNSFRFVKGVTQSLQLDSIQKVN